MTDTTSETNRDRPEIRLSDVGSGRLAYRLITFYAMPCLGYSTMRSLRTQRML